MPSRVALAGAFLPALAAGFAWFLAASRLMYRLGAPDAAVLVGVFSGAAVALMLVRLGAGDRERASRARLSCPRCTRRLQTSLAHATLGGRAVGLREWRCDACGYSHAEALTAGEPGS